MVRKDCPRCSQASYSSCEYGEWTCPTCGADLTSLRVKPPGRMQVVPHLVALGGKSERQAS